MIGALKSSHPHITFSRVNQAQVNSTDVANENLADSFDTVRSTSTEWARLIGADITVQTEAILAYNAHAGHVYAAERAKMLVPYYNQSGEYRANYNTALRDFGKIVCAKALEHRLSQVSVSDKFVALAGGAASGKSTLLDEIASRYTHRPHALLDSTFRSLDKSMYWIDLALSKNKTVDVYYIYRPVLDAARSSIKRALKSGKTVSLRELADAHEQIPKTLQAVAGRYHNDGRVNMFFCNNANFDNRPPIVEFSENQAAYVFNNRLRNTFEAVVAAAKDELAEAAAQGSPYLDVVSRSIDVIAGRNQVGHDRS